MTTWAHGLATLAEHYDGFVLDQFGVLHDGHRTRIADHVGRAALRIDRSDVFDGPVELLVDEPRRDGDVCRHLVLDAQRRFLHAHRIETLLF